MGAVARLIGHHPSGLTIAIELGLVALLVLFFVAISVRERRRRTGRARRLAEMRDD